MSILFSDVKKKTFRSTSNVTDVQKSNFTEQDFESPDFESYVKSIRKCLQMFSLEEKFMNKLLAGDGDATNKVLNRIFEPVLRYLRNEGEVYF